MSDYRDDEISAHASASYEAIRALNHDTITLPTMTPAGVSDTIGHLAAMAAALPQTCAQLSRVLDQTSNDQDLSMDEMVSQTDAGLAIGEAQIHLDEARGLAVELYKLLDAAHQVTAHIISNGPRSNR